VSDSIILSLVDVVRELTDAQMGDTEFLHSSTAPLIIRAVDDASQADEVIAAGVGAQEGEVPAAAGGI